MLYKTCEQDHYVEMVAWYSKKETFVEGGLNILMYNIFFISIK